MLWHLYLMERDSLSVLVPREAVINSFYFFLSGSFPCKFHHTNNGCYQGDKCRFSHDPLTSETYELLLTVSFPSAHFMACGDAVARK